MNSYVLDTNIALILARGRGPGEKLASQYALHDLRRPGVVPVISIVSHAELFVLAERNGWGSRQQEELRGIIDACVTIPINNDVVKAYVKVAAACRNVENGAIQLAHNDMWIGATALVTKLPLLTTDKDLIPLDGSLFEVCYVDQATLKS